MFGAIKNYFFGLTPVAKPDAGGLTTNAKKLLSLYQSGKLEWNDLLYMTGQRVDNLWLWKREATLNQILSNIYSGSVNGSNISWIFGGDAQAVINYVNRMKAYEKYMAEKQAQDSAKEVALKKQLEELRLQSEAALAQADVERQRWLKEKMNLEQSILKAKLAREQALKEAQSSRLAREQEEKRILEEKRIKKEKLKKKAKIGAGIAVAALIASQVM